MTSIVHAITSDEVLVDLGADRRGVSSEEATRRFEEEGPNRLPDAARSNPEHSAVPEITAVAPRETTHRCQEADDA
jgi:hypothetical protein